MNKQSHYNQISNISNNNSNNRSNLIETNVFSNNKNNNSNFNTLSNSSKEQELKLSLRNMYLKDINNNNKLKQSSHLIRVENEKNQNRLIIETIEKEEKKRKIANRLKQEQFFNDYYSTINNNLDNKTHHIKKELERLHYYKPNELIYTNNGNNKEKENMSYSLRGNNYNDYNDVSVESNDNDNGNFGNNKISSLKNGSYLSTINNYKVFDKHDKSNNVNSTNNNSSSFDRNLFKYDYKNNKYVKNMSVNERIVNTNTNNNNNTYDNITNDYSGNSEYNKYSLYPNKFSNNRLNTISNTVSEDNSYDNKIEKNKQQYNSLNYNISNGNNYNSISNSSNSIYLPHISNSNTSNSSIIHGNLNNDYLYDRNRYLIASPYSNGRINKIFSIHNINNTNEEGYNRDNFFTDNKGSLREIESKKKTYNNYNHNNQNPDVYSPVS